MPGDPTAVGLTLEVVDLRPAPSARPVWWHAVTRHKWRVEARKKRRLRRSSWRVVARTRIARLESMIGLADAHGGANAGLAQARALLDKALQTLDGQSETGSTWWNGSLQDQVWREIHMAEALTVSLLPDAERQKRTAEIVFDAKSILDHDDPILQAAAGFTESPMRPASAGTQSARDDTASRVLAYELVRRYREAWDDRYTRSRSFRNRLIALIGTVTFFVAALIAAGSLGVIPLEAAARSQHAVGPARLDAALALAVAGAIGGLISGASEVVKVGGVYNPFSLPWYMLFFKIPMGALTGILGVLAIKGDLVTEFQITKLNPSQTIVWALIFGASQQLLTFFVDRRVKALSSSNPREQVVLK